MSLGKYLVFASIGFELVGLILGAYYFGTYLDQKYGGNGLYFVILAFAALIGWLIQIILFLRKFQKEDEASAKSEKPS
jgi:uncharacterized membrane protein